MRQTVIYEENSKHENRPGKRTLAHLFRVVKLSVCAGADFVDNRRLKVDEDGARYVLAGTRLREEGVEGIVTPTDGLVLS